MIRQEEAQIGALRGYFAGIVIAVGGAERHLLHRHAAQPVVIGLRVVSGIDAREEHRQGTGISKPCGFRYRLVTVFFVGRSLFLALYALAFLIAYGIGRQGLFLRVVGFAHKERAAAVLLAAEVGAEGEDVFGRVLVHRRVLRGADHDDGIRGVAYHQHQHAEQRGIEETLAQQVVALFVLHIQHKHECAEHNDADGYCAAAVAVERYAEQGDGERVEHYGAFAVFLRGAPNSGEHHADQHEQINHHARVERQAEGVHEEQLEPAAHLHDAGHYAVEHGSHEHHRNAEGDERAAQAGLGRFLIIIYQGDGGQAEQVEQVHADAKSREVENKHEPAVRVGLIGVVLPFQNQPEHQGGEHRGVGINFALDGREPERVAPRVSQRARQAARHY